MKKYYYLNRSIIFFFFTVALIAKPYRGGELRTLDSYRFGRYEVRMRSAEGSGVLSSFFTYRDFWSEGLNGSQHWNEIDWEWLGLYDDKIQTNLIIQNTWDLPELVDTNSDPHQDFHNYAIEWTPDHVAFFIDDELVRFVDNFYADSLYHYQKIMMNIWQPTYVDWVGEFDSEILPVYAFYDWVKYYAYVPGSGNAGTDNNYILLWTDEFDYFDPMRWERATHTFDNNNVDFIEANVVFNYGYMILCMTTPGNTGYSGDPLYVEDNIITSFSIGNAYPNPFNHNVTIPLSVNKAGLIYFTLYDINGKVIKNGQNNFDISGNVNFHWDGLAHDGRPVSAGPYFIKLSDNISSQTKKILYLK
jgi:hypothetical protein|tara:strand:+ start:1430 stop:2509 length:1080 start_codon:yes stop_codon:yes gene_type:complete